MGEAKRKALTVSVLIPERGRPEMLDRLITSLLQTAAGDAHIEILVAIDDDDPAWTGREPFMHSQTRYFRWPRPLTLGEKINRLKDEATGDLMWFIANDMVMETSGWPTKFRQAVAQLPNGIGVAFVRDDLHPGHASYPILTRRFVEAVGFFVPPCYPFWWIDTHLDALGILIGQHHEVDVVVSAPEGRGKTHGLIDLPFWVSFYEALAPIRMREAIQLAAAAHGEGTPAFQTVMRQIGQRQQVCAARTAHLSSPEFLAHWGGNAESAPPPSYPQVKAYAEQMMVDLQAQTPKRPRVAICTPSGRAIEATTSTCITAMAAHSAMAGIDIAVLNVQSSDVAHGRNGTVEIALKEGCDWLLWVDSDMRFPPDTLMRLLNHGRDIVGATYNKRVANADGSYTTLGKFAGTRPDVMHPGLHEALLLPGGMMLVKADVYRKIGWPFFAMAYKIPGADGLDSFQKLMRAYFFEAPPEEALAELAGTKFGEWLRHGNVLGEYGEDVPTFSEDLFFCRRARRAGYKIWCDLSLTYEVAHLGEIPVTCLPPPAEKMAAD